MTNTNPIRVGSSVRDTENRGNIINKQDEYHVGRDEFVTVVSIEWSGGRQTRHLLEDFERYGGGIVVE